MADWKRAEALSIVQDDMKIMATDETLASVLATAKGPDGLRSLAWLLLGGFEDGADVTPEPLLDEDMMIDLRHGHALIKVQATVAPPPPPKPSRGSIRHERDDFMDLSEAIEADQEEEAQALLVETADFAELFKSVPLDASRIKSNDASRITSNVCRRSKAVTARKKKTRIASSRRARGGRNQDVEKLIKAVRYVRREGAGIIHPGAKMKLHGLQMQAQYGDCPLAVHEAGEMVLQKNESAAVMLEQEAEAVASKVLHGSSFVPGTNNSVALEL